MAIIIHICRGFFIFKCSESLGKTCDLKQAPFLCIYPPEDEETVPILIHKVHLEELIHLQHSYPIYSTLPLLSVLPLFLTAYTLDFMQIIPID